MHDASSILRRLPTILMALIAIAAVPAANAADVRAGELTLGSAWARATPPGIKVGAAYLAIRNASDRSDRLLSVSSPRATSVEVHATIRDMDTVRMQRIDPLHVGARETVKLEPNGKHLMLMGLKQPLKEGEQLPLTFTFERAGKVTVRARVVAPGGGEHAGH